MKIRLFYNISFARNTKRIKTHASVQIVSSKDAGVTAQMMDVSEFPPRETCSSRVNLLSRKQTCPWPSLSCLMTSPSCVNDKLMCLASLKRSPVAPVAATLSEPARSTRLIRETLAALSSFSYWASLLSTVWKSGGKKLEFGFDDVNVILFTHDLKDRVTAAAPLVHVGLADSTVLVALFHQSQYGVGASCDVLTGVHESQALLLVDLQVGQGAQEIVDLLVVNLDVGDSGKEGKCSF